MRALEPGIVCTIGPASESPETMRRMAGEGMSIARFNFSHGSRDSHAVNMDRIRRLNSGEGFRVGIMQDLEGYRIRVKSAGGKNELELEKGRRVFWGTGETGAEDYVRFDYEGPLEAVMPGTEIFADDGMISFRVVSSSPSRLETRVVLPGVLRVNKGINLPGIDLEFSGLKEKDRLDIDFVAEKGVDYVAQSFVRSAADVKTVRALLERKGASSRLVSKIECRQGLENLEDIIEESDGIMIARGDLGVSVPVYKIPVIQKRIIGDCLRRGRFVITATQMLESMTDYPRPTRAEVSDVANAVIDGSDFLMLSGETAAGKYPVETVTMMRKIKEYTLRHAPRL